MRGRALQGDWVRIHDTVLDAGRRSDRLPPETRAVPLEMWVKGFLIDGQAGPGDRVTVETAAGRRVEGVLVDLSPSWSHGFGDHVPELDELGRRMRRWTRESSEESGT